MIKKTGPLYILDTHIWIWLINGEKNIRSSRFLKTISQKNSELNVSVISVWEVGMLEAKGRIVLPFSCLEWVHRALKAPGILLTPLTPEIAIESSRLPGDFHGDPADRIIVATTRSLGATLVTKDKNILTYAKKQGIPTISL